MDEVNGHRPGVSTMPNLSVQALVDALATLRGRGDGQIFGLAADKIEDEGRDPLQRRIIGVLAEWKRTFEAVSDPVSLVELDRVGAVHEIDDLRLTQRIPLRGDPLGTKEGLSPGWLERLGRLEEAKAGHRHLDVVAVHWVGSDETDKPVLSFGHADEATMYAFALRFEATCRMAFPRELAAFWTIANGILIEDDPFLFPVAQWTWEDRGLCIGCGGYVQGSLTLEGAPAKKGNLLKAKLVDRDDDGVVRARYPSFESFADALLGT